uniref:Tyrosyl-DNA phosphodiesterase 1 n=1 Tax=Denticeps clupeoides TaxID=299321 RepID=A0AAY4A8Q1_9TELE
MSKESQHGKWSLSSSDDEDVPAARSDAVDETAKSEPPESDTFLNVFFPQSDPEPRVEPEASPLVEKYKDGPSPAAKRKRESEEAGWALSSSDEDETPRPGRRGTSPKRIKTEDARPPSPHGRVYYIEEPADFFETSFSADSEVYRFYLNKVTGLEKKFNAGAIHIKEILSPVFGTLKESVQFNYCFDIPWMVEQYPPEFRYYKPITVVHGEKRESKARLVQQAQPYGHVRLSFTVLICRKMMLLWYEEGFRVVILTSNLIRADWYQKTQGLWMSPLYPRLPEGSPETAGESSTNFKHDLIEYLSAYRAPELSEWIDRIKEHDLSETRVYLIGSTPGRYVGPDMEKWGHLRLRKLLMDHTTPVQNEEKWPVVCQFSSIGSMGLDKTKWLAGEFQRTLTTLGKGRAALSPETQVMLVYPSVDNVRTSLEGYPAGGSLPYSIQTAQKQLWLHAYFHQWRAETTGRSRAMPHIKTFMRASPDFSQLAWFLITSANLSKAAWGALEKNNTQMMVRSYELGVLYLPSAFKMSTFTVQKKVFPADSSSSGFPVPFDLPPERYSSKDQPWIWNIPYTQAPDTHGNVWVPS